VLCSNSGIGNYKTFLTTAKLCFLESSPILSPAQAKVNVSKVDSRALGKAFILIK